MIINNCYNYCILICVQLLNGCLASTNQTKENPFAYYPVTYNRSRLLARKKALSKMVPNMKAYSHEVNRCRYCWYSSFAQKPRRFQFYKQNTWVYFTDVWKRMCVEIIKIMLFAKSHVSLLSAESVLLFASSKYICISDSDLRILDF